MNSKLKDDCEEILRKIIAKHGFLQPDSPNFDKWDRRDAAEIVADLIQEIKYSDEIAKAHAKDWGK